MIKPHLHGFVSPDIPAIWQWVPESADEIHYYLEMTIGPEPGQSDLFGLTIVSPQALLALTADKAVWGRHCLIVLNYDWKTVHDHIKEVIKNCEGGSWEKVSVKLSRYFYWEYEDYLDAGNEKRGRG